MSKRVGVFIDANNLYYFLRRKYRDRKLDYKAYLQFVEDLGEITQSIVYGCQHPKDASPFISSLKHIGFETNFFGNKMFPINCCGRMAVDILTHVTDYDTIIIGSNDVNLLSLIKYLTEQGIKVILFASNIGKVWSDIVENTIEIPESLLEEKK